MKRWAVISLMGVAFVLLLALVVVAALGLGPDNSKFIVGKALPPGKVAPQLVIDYMERAVLLAPDGTVWFWGGDPSHPAMSSFASLASQPRAPKVMAAAPQRISDDTDWKQVALASSSLLGLKSDGSLWSWSSTVNSRSSPQTSTSGKFVPPGRIGTDSDWVQISGRVSHFMALKADGSLWGWGQNESGQIGNGVSNSSKVLAPVMVGTDHDWKAIAAGAFNSYALKRDGTLWGWGSDVNSSGQIPNKNVYSPEQIDPGTNWAAISVGDYHLLALKSDGTIWLRGQNAHITASSAFPSAPRSAPSDKSILAQVGHDNDWDRICSGDNCFFARKRDGSWWACGSGSGGQLGIGRPINSIATGTAGVRGGTLRAGALLVRQNVASPQRLPFDFEPWAFGSGGSSTLLLTRDGSLWSWGTRLGSSKSKSVKEWYNDAVAWTQKTFHLKSQTPAQTRMAMRVGGGSFGSGGFGSGGFGSSMINRPVTDYEPYRIWKIPADVRKALEKNADKPAEAQSAKQP